MGVDPGEAAWVHLLAEIERRVFADRAVYLGDPDFYEVPVEGLLNDEYLRRRMVSFDPRKASSSSDVTAGTLLSGTQGDGQSERSEESRVGKEVVSKC